LGYFIITDIIRDTICLRVGHICRQVLPGFDFNCFWLILPNAVDFDWLGDKGRQGMMTHWFALYFVNGDH
jgi:hypothetical protein